MCTPQPAPQSAPQPTPLVTGRAGIHERLAAAQAALRLQNEMADTLAARGAQRDPRGAALLDQVQRRAVELRGQITELRAMGARA